MIFIFNTLFVAIDDNVLNILSHDNLTDSLYGLARDRKSYLKSDDHGHTWWVNSLILNETTNSNQTFNTRQRLYVW